jgi:outer membrane receptor for ferrienterochelin and colicin
MASLQNYSSRWAFDPFGASRNESNAQGNLAAAWPFHPSHELAFGGHLRHRDTEILGRFAADSTDYLPGAPAREHATRPVVDDAGFYLENKMRLWGPLYATIGGRLDHASRPGVWTADPRAALAWRLDDHQTLRVATGRYHQLPDADVLDPTYGNPDLGPMRADHVIAGYEWASDFGTVRLEAFRKDYRDLVADDSTRFYANHGHGYARGVDVLVQGTWGWLSGWVTYGFLDTRRKEMDAPYEAPSAYGVRHSLILVGRYRVTSSWELGARYHYRTGQAFTPVVAASFDSSRGIWRPVEGEYHGERMPDYGRLDVRAVRMFSLPAAWRLPPSSVCVLYVEALNALGTRNVLDYVYSEDYSVRRAVDSYFSRRYVVAGISLSW